MTDQSNENDKENKNAYIIAQLANLHHVLKEIESECGTNRKSNMTNEQLIRRLIAQSVLFDTHINTIIAKANVSETHIENLRTGLSNLIESIRMLNTGITVMQEKNKRSEESDLIMMGKIQDLESVENQNIINFRDINRELSGIQDTLKRMEEIQLKHSSRIKTIGRRLIEVYREIRRISSELTETIEITDKIEQGRETIKTISKLLKEVVTIFFAFASFLGVIVLVYFVITGERLF